MAGKVVACHLVRLQVFGIWFLAPVGLSYEDIAAWFGPACQSPESAGVTLPDPTCTQTADGVEGCVGSIVLGAVDVE